MFPSISGRTVNTAQHKRKQVQPRAEPVLGASRAPGRDKAVNVKAGSFGKKASIWGPPISSSSPQGMEQLKNQFSSGRENPEKESIGKSNPSVQTPEQCEAANNTSWHGQKQASEGPCVHIQYMRTIIRDRRVQEAGMSSLLSWGVRMVWLMPALQT